MLMSFLATTPQEFLAGHVDQMMSDWYSQLMGFS
jgi:hypothetical protein